jgi:hypothetical protein
LQDLAHIRNELSQLRGVFPLFIGIQDKQPVAPRAVETKLAGFSEAQKLRIAFVGLRRTWTLRCGAWNRHAKILSQRMKPRAADRALGDDWGTSLNHNFEGKRSQHLVGRLLTPWAEIENPLAGQRPGL